MGAGCCPGQVFDGASTWVAALAMVPVPQPINPQRTYQEHEDDRALVDVVH